MRIATFNLMGGRSISDGQLVASRLAEAIAELDADLLAVQEVDRNQARSERRDLAAEVAAALGAVDHRYEPTVIGTPGEKWRAVGTGAALLPQDSTYGIALMSRRPVLRWTTLPLSPAPIYGPVVVPGPKRPRLLMIQDEPRAVIAATVQGATGEVLIAATHLSFVPGWNVVQLRRALRAIRAEPAEHRLLMGDLNLPGRLSARISGWQQLALGPTWPANAPRVQFDHVLSQHSVVIGAARTVELGVSDHRAVVVDLPEL